jgi:hypothetical protein
VRREEMTGVTGTMTGEMHGIRGKRAVMQPGRRSKNARKQTIKVIGNVGRTNETPRTMHATLPGTSNETRDERFPSESVLGTSGA